MSRLQRILCIVCALAALIVMVTGAPARAWDQNQHYRNNTGETAHGLTKVLAGNNAFINVQLNQPFPSFQQAQFGGYTLGHWYGDSVAAGDEGHACFSLASTPVPAFASFWTNDTGGITGYAGPIMTVNLHYDCNTGIALLGITNEWHQWNGTEYPPQRSDGLGGYVGTVTLSDVYYAVVDSAYTDLSHLDSNLIGALAWETVGIGDPPPVEPGETYTDTLHMYPRGSADALILRFNAFGDGQESFYVVQTLCEGRPVPSLTNWGLAVLVVLLIISAATVLYRRRHALA
jgi:hypothetical protein